MPEQILDRKIFEVTKQLGIIEKDGWNENQKYKFLSEAQVKQAIRPLLEEQQLRLIPLKHELVSVTPLGKQHLTTVRCVFAIRDIETGQQEEWEAHGSGADSTDKGMAKANTQALKIALANGFNIVTGDDPEKTGKNLGAGTSPVPKSTSGGRRKDPDAPISAPQQKRMFALMSKAGKNAEQVKAIIKAHGFEHSKDVTIREYDVICEEIEAG
jgi:hypothetical protein